MVKLAYTDADFVVITVPTNYDSVKNYFDTNHIEEVIYLIPVGYTRNLYLKYARKE